jgi:putative membrane protein
MTDGMSNAWSLQIGYGWIIGLIVLIIIIGLMSDARRRRKNASKQKFNSPLDILKSRYARGEISKNEFEEKKREIS